MLRLYCICIVLFVGTSCLPSNYSGIPPQFSSCGQCPRATNHRICNGTGSCFNGYDSKLAQCNCYANWTGPRCEEPAIPFLQFNGTSTPSSSGPKDGIIEAILGGAVFVLVVSLIIACVCARTRSKPIKTLKQEQKPLLSGRSSGDSILQSAVGTPQEIAARAKYLICTTDMPFIYANVECALL